MDRVRRGDFVVPEKDLEQAQDVFENRPPRAQSFDKATRGPITTDIETYRNMGGAVLDYPGVDTPTQDPKRRTADFLYPYDFDAAPPLVDQEQESVKESLQFTVEETKASVSHLWNALTGPK